jgi:endonuclease G
MSRKYIYPFLTVLLVVGLYYAEQYVSQNSEVYPETSEEKVLFNSSEFKEDLLPVSTTGVIIEHNYFTLSYNEAHEQAEWVAYPLLKAHLSKNEFDRPDFIEDRKIGSKSAHWSSYKNSGYDRGHLCPAGDRRFSFNAYAETFLTSNISPQNRDLNGGIWNKLEQQFRFWAKKYDGVYIVTGGVLKEGLPTIGLEKVSVPEQFYKIVLDASDGTYKVLAFLIPNKPTNKSFYDYVVTVDSVETVTGIDFFPKLPKEIQDNIESGIDLKAWGER